MTEPSNWAMEQAGMLLWGYVPEEGGSGLNPKLLQQWAKTAAALDAARQKGIEEAALRVVGIVDSVTGRPISELIRETGRMLFCKKHGYRVSESCGDCIQPDPCYLVGP